MEKDEYLNQMKLIEKEFESKKYALYTKYAISNAKFKIGDTIKDERWAFVVDKITVSVMFGFPEPVYNGFQLRSDLTPRKDGARVTIYGNDAELIKPAQS